MWKNVLFWIRRLLLGLLFIVLIIIYIVALISILLVLIFFSLFSLEPNSTFQIDNVGYVKFIIFIIVKLSIPLITSMVSIILGLKLLKTSLPAVIETILFLISLSCCAVAYILNNYYFTILTTHSEGFWK